MIPAPGLTVVLIHEGSSVDSRELIVNRLGGQVVKTPTTRAADLGSNPAQPLSSHTSDFKICTPEATLPGVWLHRFSAGTGWPGVSIL